MKSAILLLALFVVFFSSCTTAYKTGQTPDDVYYSPVRPQEEYVQSEKRNDRKYRNSDDYYEDRYLRMKVQNRNQWSDLDDWYGSERRYRYIVYTGYNLYNNPWTPQTYWNSNYNPYYNHCYTPSYSSVKQVAYNKPRTFNLNAYTTTTTTNTRSNNNKFRSYEYNTNATYNESRNSNSNSGNFLRTIFNGNNSSSGSKVNSSSGNSGSGSGSSGSSGSTAPVRKF